MLSCSNHIAHFLQLLSLFIYTKTDEIVSANASAHTIRIPKAIICFEMFCIHYMPSSSSMYLASTKPKSKRKSSNGKSTRNGNESETNYGHKLEYLCIYVSLWHVYFTRTCTVQISYEKWHNWHAIKKICADTIFSLAFVQFYIHFVVLFWQVNCKCASIEIIFTLLKWKWRRLNWQPGNWSDRNCVYAE